MKSIEYKISDENGLHARPAGLIVKCAGNFEADIVIKFGEKSADAKRIFAVMGLGVKKGDVLTVTADGKDESEALEAIEKLLKENL